MKNRTTLERDFNAAAHRRMGEFSVVSKESLTVLPKTGPLSPTKVGFRFLFIYSDLRPVVDAAIEEVAAHIGESATRIGGYLGVFALPLASIGIADMAEYYRGWVGGDGNREREPMYQTLSHEKAIRLALRSKTCGQCNSRQSSKPKSHLFGGAVILQCKPNENHVNGAPKELRLIVSLSGLDDNAEHNGRADEAVAAMMAVELGWASVDAIRKVVAGNNFANHFLDRLEKKQR